MWPPHPHSLVARRSSSSLTVQDSDMIIAKFKRVLQNKFLYINLLSAQAKLVVLERDIRNTHRRNFAFEPSDAHLDESRMFIEIGGSNPFFVFVTSDGQYASAMNNQTFIITDASPKQLLGKINDFLLPVEKRTERQRFSLMKSTSSTK